MTDVSTAPPTLPDGRPPFGSRRSPGRRGGRRGGRRRAPYLIFCLPAFLVLLFGMFIPTLQAVHFALTDWNGYSQSFNYVGLDNFTRVLSGDSLFTNALSNNVTFMLVVVVAQTAFSLVLAVLLARNSRSSTLLRALFFFPTILSSVSVAFIWKFIYDPNVGLLNTTTGALGLEALRSPFLADDGSAIYWVALTQVWFHAGQVMVIFIAGLQNVPREYYEAASLDGASSWQQFRTITWPMIAPATTIVAVYTTIQSFKAFDLIIGMGGNPPRGSLDILSTRIYTSFANSEFGYASAQSIVFVAVVLIVTFLLRRGLGLTQKQI